MTVAVTLRNEGTDTVQNGWSGPYAGAWTQRGDSPTWLWHPHDKLYFDAAWHRTEYPPGYEETVRWDWSLVMCDGRPLPPGDYSLIGYWTVENDGLWVSNAIQFEIM